MYKDTVIAKINIIEDEINSDAVFNSPIFNINVHKENLASSIDYIMPKLDYFAKTLNSEATLLNAISTDDSQLAVTSDSNMAKPSVVLAQINVFNSEEE